MRIIFTIVLLFGWTLTAWTQSGTIAVPLHLVGGYLPGSYELIGTQVSTYMSGYEEQEFAPFKGIPHTLIEKKIRSLDFIKGQHNYELYKKGHLKRPDWQSFVKRLRIDTTQLSPYPIKSTINILIGKDTAARRVIIVDANNNQDFSDDQVLSYPMTLTGYKLAENGLYGYAIKPIIDSLPAVNVAVEAYDGRAVRTHQIVIQPNPYPYIVRPTGPFDTQFYLSLGIHEHRSGLITLLGDSLEFLVGSGSFELQYNTVATEIRINALGSGSPKPSSLEPIKYRLGQTFLVSNHLIELQRITPLGDTLYLADKGVFTNQLGSQPGFYSPPIIGLGLDGTEFDLKKQPGEYIVLDFWGSWCGPCLQMLPQLKAFAQQYLGKPVRLVSIAYEKSDDLTALRQVVSQHQLNWSQLWETRSSVHSLVKTLAIEAYPTTLLIAPNGQILYRATSQSGFTELISRLAKELGKKNR